MRLQLIAKGCNPVRRAGGSAPSHGGAPPPIARPAPIIFIDVDDAEKVAFLMVRTAQGAVPSGAFVLSVDMLRARPARSAA